MPTIGNTSQRLLLNNQLTQEFPELQNLPQLTDSLDEVSSQQEQDFNQLGLLLAALGMIQQQTPNQNDPLNSLNAFRVAPTRGFQDGGSVGGGFSGLVDLLVSGTGTGDRSDFARTTPQEFDDEPFPFVDEEGNPTDSPVNTTGFRDDAPTRRNRVNIIPSPFVTMDNVGKALLATPFSQGQLGQPVLLRPGMPTTFFPGADGVIEQPADTAITPIEVAGRVVKAPEREEKKSGGSGILSSIDIGSLMKKQTGGTVVGLENLSADALDAVQTLTEVFAMSNNQGFPEDRTIGNFPFNFTFQLGGPVSRFPGLVPIQTEAGEKVIHIDNSITSVAAKKPHDKLPDDMVTDILPEGSYILSKDKDMSITKDWADKITFAPTFDTYSEHKAPAVPRQERLSDFFGTKNKLTPAELGERIKRRYPTSKKKFDIFTESTNEINKESRTAPLQALMALSELQKADIAIDILKGEGIQVFRRGGYVRKGELEKPRMQMGGFFQGTADISVGIANMIFANKMRKANFEDIERATTEQRGLQTAGAFAGIGSVLAQDPTVRAPQLSTSFLDQIETRTPRSLTDFQIARQTGQLSPLVRGTFANTGSFQRATTSLSPTFSQSLNTVAAAARADALLDQQRRNQLRQQRQTILNQQLLANVDATNRTQANVNRNLASVGSISGGLANSLSSIAGSEAAARIAARNLAFSQIVESSQQVASGFGEIGGAFDIASFG